jgi:hypothetical protein
VAFPSTPTFGLPERHTGNPFHIREPLAAELRGLLYAFQQVSSMASDRPKRIGTCRS